MEKASSPVAEICAITKLFGGLPVVDQISFPLYAGEAVALVGGNGSGKSTLMKIVAGLIQPSSGEIRILSNVVSFSHPADGLRVGIAMVYQDDPICPELSVTENVLLGQEVTSGGKGIFGFVRHGRSRKKAYEALQRVNFSEAKLKQAAGNLSGGKRKALAIARALLANPKILILDEPTNSLGVAEQKVILELVLQCPTRGVSLAL